MPIYRIFIDGIETGTTVDASDYVNAYFNVASSQPIPYRNEISLVEITDQTEEIP
ncbi:MAG: hypothetical protein E6713_13285 [Sporomusaceae bacterium]|nr:hypothetical protein [Sporomusaceae bacterium]